MTNVGKTWVTPERIGVLEIDSPPVNAIGAEVRRALFDGIGELAIDPAVDAIVLICAGRTFFAGGDIRELSGPILHPWLIEVFDRIEASPKPVIAAIHGTALGGGYELSLVCHHRIAVPSARVGLPEVNLGIAPGGGGTQRLPRVVGPDAAMEIMASGKPIGAEKALELGMIDALAEEGRLLDDAIAYARRIADAGAPLRLVRNREGRIAEARGKPHIYADFLTRHAEAFRGFKAPFAIAEAVEAAVELPFDEGYAVEQRLSDELMHSIEAEAQRYHFFAERAAAKSVGLDALADRGPGSIAGRLLAAIEDAARRAEASAEAIDAALYDYGFAPELLSEGFGPYEVSFDKLLLPAVNEAAKLIDEGITTPASNIDIAAIKGLGWPVYRGGPLFWGDAVGLDAVIAGLRAMGIAPATVLLAKAESGGKLVDG